MDELEKNYNPKQFEDKIYSQWQEKKVFTPILQDRESNPFVVVMPPPNVTGILHMGHGLNMSLQDILIRYHKMQGEETLWVPGTDHAGIATQSVVERQLKEEKLPSRKEMGREAFVEKVWQTKEKHHGFIKSQMERLGLSVDWSRERFTLEEDLSKAVSHCFIELYNKGLIYKGEYLVNWDPSTQSAISDEEVEHKEVMGALYKIAYPLVDGSGSLEIATTRPETLFGDTAIAVHPEDERYKNLLGKKVHIPLTDREVIIIADSYVDPAFGTGAVKITPAHDPNDFEMGNRHNLERINVMNPDATLNEKAGKFSGLNRKEARKAIVKALKEEGFLLEEKPHKQQVGHCDRTGEVIEPYLSTQWFVKMKPMAEKGLEALEKGKIRFYPKHWENTYKHWMENIRDWCISRQLWWGHRIPVWYDVQNEEMVVSATDPALEEKYKGRIFRQEEDVLDTWFSSWLWPFSVMGWPQNTQDLKRFYPTTTLVTGYDIIFFWVARMVMAGIEFIGEVPFKDIYITPLIRDKKGRKMSKSLGNGIDPIEVIDLYGSDALKFTLSFLSAQGQDLPIDLETFKFGSKFANKVWNASRLILTRGEGLSYSENFEKDGVDYWLLSSFSKTILEVEKAMKAYRFNDASKAVYEFFWQDFCDWYLEIQKINFQEAEKSGDVKRSSEIFSKLVYFLKESLLLLHPFLPFITEEIASHLPLEKKEFLASSLYPRVNEEDIKENCYKEFEFYKEWVSSLRTIRSEFSLAPNLPIKVEVSFEEGFKARELFLILEEKSKSLLKAESIVEIDSLNKTQGIGSAGKGWETQALIKDFIDIPKEKARLTKNYEHYRNLVEKTELKINNPSFKERAPKELVAFEEQKLNEFKKFQQMNKEYLDNLI